MSKTSKPKKFQSAIKWILWVLLFQFLLMNISASIHAWKLTHFYTDPELRVIKPSSRNVFVKTWKLFAGLKYPRSVITSFPPFPIDTVRLKTGSGILIDCWYSKPDSAAQGSVILLHGYGTNKNYFTHEAEEFRSRGYNVLLVDFRGHGNSGGNTTTLGFRESEEVKLAYDYLQQSGEHRIFLWGMSLGAVAITKAVSDYELKPAGLILEMPFACLQSQLEARSRVFGFPEEPFGWLVTAWVGIERGYYGFGHQTTRYVKKVNCPVLLQWGSHDRYVLKEETTAVFNNIASPNKRLVVYEDADHQSLLGYDPEKWRLETGAFLEHPEAVHP